MASKPTHQHRLEITIAILNRTLLATSSAHAGPNMTKLLCVWSVMDEMIRHNQMLSIIPGDVTAGNLLTQYRRPHRLNWCSLALARWMKTMMMMMMMYERRKLHVGACMAAGNDCSILELQLFYIQNTLQETSKHVLTNCKLYSTRRCTVEVSRILDECTIFQLTYWRTLAEPCELHAVPTVRDSTMCTGRGLCRQSPDICQLPQWRPLPYPCRWWMSNKSSLQMRRHLAEQTWNPTRRSVDMTKPTRHESWFKY